MERTDKGVNNCHLCGSRDLEPNLQARPDRRQRLVCRNCGTAVNVSHWVVHRAQGWTEVTYVTQNGKPEGRVIAFAAPSRLVFAIPPRAGQPLRTTVLSAMFPARRGRAGLTPEEISFATMKLKQPERGAERVGRLYITPRAIKDEAELQRVQAEVDKLLGRELDAYEELYLSYLGNLIYEWEQEHERW